MELEHIDQTNITFHLGLEKTGSTFLQLNIFRNLSGIRYHRKSRFKYFQDIILKAPESKHFFTFETDRELPFNVDKIARVLPYANVFLILRRHDSWLASQYHYHIRKHGFLTVQEFFDLENDAGFRKKQELLLRPKIDYIETHMKGRVLFLNFGELKSDPAAYVQRIVSFLQADLDPTADIHRARKKAFSLKQNRILMKFNRFYRYQKAETSSRFLNKVHYKYREFLLHTVAFLARFVPQSLVSQEPLIPKGYLEEVRAYYEEDWQYVLSKVNQPRQLAEK
jgi:hypothetical protein